MAMPAIFTRSLRLQAVRISSGRPLP